MKHEVTPFAEQRGDGQLWHRSRCTCGRYLSGLYGSVAGAMRAGSNHATAMNKREG